MDARHGREGWMLDTEGKDGCSTDSDSIYGMAWHERIDLRMLDYGRNDR